MPWNERRVAVTAFVCTLVLVAGVSAELIRRGRILYLAECVSRAGTERESLHYARKLADAASEETLQGMIVNATDPTDSWLGGLHLALGLKDTAIAHGILEGLLGDPKYQRSAIQGLAYAPTYDPARLFQRFAADKAALWCVVTYQMAAGRADALALLEEYYREAVRVSPQSPTLRFVRQHLSANGVTGLDDARNSPKRPDPVNVSDGQFVPGPPVAVEQPSPSPGEETRSARTLAD